jgi:hypothetical protein
VEAVRDHARDESGRSGEEVYCGRELVSTVACPDERQLLPRHHDHRHRKIACALAEHDDATTGADMAVGLAEDRGLAGGLEDQVGTRRGALRNNGLGLVLMNGDPEPERVHSAATLLARLGDDNRARLAPAQRERDR